MLLHGLPAGAAPPDVVATAEKQLRRCVRARTRRRECSQRTAIPSVAWELRQAAAALAVRDSSADGGVGHATGLLSRNGLGRDTLSAPGAGEEAALLEFSRWCARAGARAACA